MAIIKCKACGKDITVSEGQTSCVCGACGAQMTVPEQKPNKNKAKIPILVLALMIAAALVFVVVIQPRMAREKALNAGLQYLASDSLSDARKSFIEAEADDQLAKLAQYEQAIAKAEAGDFLAASKDFIALGDYAKAAERAQKCQASAYAQAKQALAAGQTMKAHETFAALGAYSDSAECAAAIESDYASAQALFAAGDYAGAQAAFAALTDYSDSQSRVTLSQNWIDYMKGQASLESGELANAVASFHTASALPEARNAIAALYADAMALMREGKYAEAKAKFEALGEYEDSAAQASTCGSYMVYEEGMAALADGDYDAALTRFASAEALSEASEAKKQLADYIAAEKLYSAGAYAEARAIYMALGAYLNAEARTESCYEKEYEAASALLNAGSVAAAHDAFAAIGEYRDSAEKAASIENDYAAASAAMEQGEWESAIEAFAALIDYKDSREKYPEARYAYAEALLAKGDKYGAEAQFASAADYQDASGRASALRMELAADAVSKADYAEALRLYLLMPQTDEMKALEYGLAQTSSDSGAYGVAAQAYEALGQYELSVIKLPIARYAYADQLFTAGEYRAAQAQFELVGGTMDSETRAKECVYRLANQLLNDKEYDAAKKVFEEVFTYGDSASMIRECDYQKAMDQKAQGDYESAEKGFYALGAYKDSAAMKNECRYSLAEADLANGNYADAQSRYELLGNYGDSAEKANLCRYRQGEAAFAQGEYMKAQGFFAAAKDYQDSAERAKQSLYSEAGRLLAAGEYDNAEKLYKKLEDYQDSAERYLECRYLRGKQKMEAKDYAGALSDLEALAYQDADTLAAKCRCGLGDEALAKGDAVKAVSEYRAALPLAEAQAALYNMGKDRAIRNDIPNAMEALWTAGEYAPAKEMLAEIADLQAQLGKTELSLIARYAIADGSVPENAPDVTWQKLQKTLVACALTRGEFANTILYAHAETLLTHLQYDEAAEAFRLLADYKDSADMAKECDYQKAAVMMQDAQYKEAYQLYLTLTGYKDVDALLKTDENLIAEAEAAREAMLAPYKKVGNIVTYGHYEQDNNTSNGKEAIEWIVLRYDAEKNQALLLSRHGLDAHVYHHTTPYPTWEKSDIRAWLNEDFLNAAFTQEEQQSIALTTVKTQDNNNVSGGRACEDRVFLLSIEEAMEYAGWGTLEDFCKNGSKLLQATPTRYAVAQGAWQYDGSDSTYKLDGRGCCWWWLRSPGFDSDSASFVRYAGSLFDYLVYSSSGAVRPAFYLDLNSLASLN